MKMPEVINTTHYDTGDLTALVQKIYDLDEALIAAGKVGRGASTIISRLVLVYTAGESGLGVLGKDRYRYTRGNHTMRTILVHLRKPHSLLKFTDLELLAMTATPKLPDKAVRPLATFLMSVVRERWCYSMCYSITGTEKNLETDFALVGWQNPSFELGVMQSAMPKANHIASYWRAAMALEAAEEKANYAKRALVKVTHRFEVAEAARDRLLTRVEKSKAAISKPESRSKV